MSYSSEVLADSPLVYLTLDDSSGTTAVDSSGNGRNMTSANCTLAQATLMPNGTSSYDFNGTSSQISLADAAWQRPTAMTVEAWIRPDSTTSFKAIAAKDGAGSGWAFYVLSGKLSLYCNGGANTGVATLSTGTTYHVAATFDSGTVKLYINGALDQTFTSKTLTQTSGTSLLVGVSTGSNGGATRTFWFDGREDEFAYYGTALSGARILAHYNAGTAKLGTLDATFPLPESAFSGTYTPLVTEGTLDAVLPLPETAFVGAYVPPPVSGTLGATFPLPTTDFAGTYLGSEVVGTLEATFPLPRSTFLGTYVGEVSTDTSNAENGRSRGGGALVESTVPEVDAPFPTSFGRVDKAPRFPDPVIVKGRPT